MNSIFLIIGIIYFFGFLLTLITILLEKIYKNKLNIIPKEYKDIYVLLPALKEQKIVTSTIDWFKQVQYKGKIKFVIITTQKEEMEYKNKKIKTPTTNQVVNKYLKQIKDERFIHYHYPKIHGNKSSQMNFAIKLIQKNYKPDSKKTYISVFDFDSQPELNTFDMLNKVSLLINNPDAINQVPLCIKNYYECSKNKIIMLLYAMHHLIRSCSIEKFKLLLSSLSNLKIPQYCMGACMHLKMSTLLENDYFPIFVDDLTLGYRMSIKGNRFAYLPTYNYSLIPNKLLDYCNSATLIFKGISTYLTEIKNTKKHLWGKIKMFTAGTGNIIVFTIIPWMLVVYYIYSIVTKNLNFTFYLCFSIPYLWCIASYIIIKINKIKDKKINSFLAFIISPIWFVFRPIGFLMYFKKLLLSKITKKDIVYKKTER